MVMMISDVLAGVPRNKKRKRIGRGIGSGHGKTAGRGTKGMGAHSSDRPHRMSEGGQMPLFRRIPKRGFSNAFFRVAYQVVNVGTLQDVFEAGTKVNAQALVDRGLIHDAARPVKILGTGELTKKLEVEATAFSGSAEEKIVKAGGQIHRLVEKKPPKPRPAPRPVGSPARADKAPKGPKPAQAEKKTPRADQESA
ncbi:MAG: hypothetical protein AMXMBFR83_26690 [Phycisphaerae bacterium]|jgi:large subunit ribosomal protein L15